MCIVTPAISGGTAFLGGVLIGVASGVGIMLIYLYVVKKVKNPIPDSSSRTPKLVRISSKDTRPPRDSAPPVIRPIPNTAHPLPGSAPPGIRSILKKTHQNHHRSHIAGTRIKQPPPSVTINES